MTSGNDKKGPPAPAPRRPAPPAPSRPSGPTSGGAAAARPASTAPGAGRPNPGARPAPAPRPEMEDLDSDARTSAFNIADMGLDDDESTVSVAAEALKAKAPPPRAAAPAPVRAAAPAPVRAAAPAPRAPAPEPEDERTTAFSIADLPPEDEVRPNPSTLVSSKPGAAVRGGAAPAKRNETLALAPSAARAVVQQAKAAAPIDEDKTTAFSMDDVGKIEAMKAARIAAKAAVAAPAPIDEDKTTAFSMDDVGKIEAMKAARIAAKAGVASPSPAPRPAAAPKPLAHIEENERTMAVSLDDAIAAVDSSPPRKPSVVKSSQAAAQAAASQSPIPKATRPAPVVDQDERTTAMSLDDIDAIDALPPRKAAAEAPAKGKTLPAKSSPAKAKGARSVQVDLAASEGFIGDIGYAFKHDALEAQGSSALDPDRKSAGMRKLIIVGGGLGALMLLFGILF